MKNFNYYTVNLVANIANMRIALLVDNPYRDLPGLVIVAWRLCQEGTTCYLVPMNLRNKEIWPLAPDFVLLNHFRTIYEDLVKNIIGAGILVGVLDTEGGVFSPTPTTANTNLVNSGENENEIMPTLQKYDLSMARDSKLRHNVACFCAWTPVFAEYAAQKGWYRAEQIVVTGTPRMDFYSTQWRDAARCMSSYIDSYPEPIILINGNFTLANPRFQSREKEVEMMVDRFSYERGFVDKLIRTQEQAMRGLASLSNKLARRFPEVTFIYRPHPFEDEEAYKQLLKPLPNLHLVKKGTVDGWLLRAKAVIHWESSTAIDSCLAGVPAFAASWLPVHLPVPAVDDVSIRCSTEDELMEHIVEVLHGNFKLPSEVAGNIDRVVEETFYKIDGYAHKRVADAVLSAVNSATSRTSIYKCRDFTCGISRNSLKARVVTSIKRTIGIPANWSIRYMRYFPGESMPVDLPWDNSDKYFDADVVKAIVDAIEACPEAERGERVRAVGVQSAQERGDYHFDYRQGRSVTVFPQ